MDKGKVNIVPPSRQAKWFHLIGVPIGNVSEMYPHGDNVQAVEPWTPPDVMGGMSDAEMEDILNRIEKGFPDGSRYTNSPSAKTRAAWKVVVDVLPEKNEQQAREIIKTWISKKILEHRTSEPQDVQGGGGVVEKRWGDTVLNCNEKWGHCSSLQ